MSAEAIQNAALKHDANSDRLCSVDGALFVVMMKRIWTMMAGSGGDEQRSGVEEEEMERSPESYTISEQTKIHT